MTAERLASVPILASLSREELDSLAAAGQERRLAAGECLFREGEPAERFHIILDGELETTHEVAGDQVTMLRHGPGGYMGAIALLTGTSYRGTTHAVGDVLLFELGGEEFHRLVLSHPPLLRQLMQVFSPVVGKIRDIERDREKLLALGSLASGLAHELNNPAAAAVRAADMLKEYDDARQLALTGIITAGAPPGEVGTLVSLAIEAMDAAGSDVPSDPLERSDREQELLRDLEERGIEEPDEIATTLVEGGLSRDWVDRVASALGDERLGPGLRFVAACAASRLLLAELRHATGRIGDLIGAVKGYSFLDQAPRQRVDVHEGIENTLAVLAHKLREGRIVIVRDFDPELPQIDASGPQLNQVWTNLIDNAIDALDGEGRITIRTGRDGERIAVEVVDDGPGIPADAQSRIFDAFFTTKGPGKGTGLGLDIARRIVVQHHGELLLDSRPGETRFRVLLPAR